MSVPLQRASSGIGIASDTYAQMALAAEAEADMIKVIVKLVSARVSVPRHSRAFELLYADSGFFRASVFPLRTADIVALDRHDTARVRRPHPVE